MYLRLYQDPEGVRGEGWEKMEGKGEGGGTEGKRKKRRGERRKDKVKYVLQEFMNTIPQTYTFIDSCNFSA